MSPSKLREREKGRGRDARLNAGLMRRECSKMGWGKNSSSLADIKVSPFSAEFDTTPLSIRDPLFALAEPVPLPHKTCPITLNRPSPIIIGPFPSLPSSKVWHAVALIRQTFAPF